MCRRSGVGHGGRHDLEVFERQAGRAVDVELLAAQHAGRARHATEAALEVRDVAQVDPAPTCKVARPADGVHHSVVKTNVDDAAVGEGVRSGRHEIERERRGLVASGVDTGALHARSGSLLTEIEAPLRSGGETRIEPLLPTPPRAPVQPSTQE